MFFDYYAGNANRYKGEKTFTSIDVALGSIDVFGWSVEVEGEGKVGKVIEILHIGRAGSNIGECSPYEYLLKVFQSPVDALKTSRELGQASIDKYEELSGTEVLIPIVDEFVRHVDTKRRCLQVQPPKGLLELARRPEVIRRLRPEIQLFCQRHAKFLQDRFIENQKIRYDSSVDLQEIVHMYMPTRDQLQAVGRFDLIRRIKAAGGFLFVAQALGLKSTRRPNGFWDDLKKLDTEIERFLWESWDEKVHEETGMIYFENYATKEVSLKKPTQSLRSQSSLVVGEGLRIMPQQKVLWKAHRWDLHHAIIWNGGYTEVAGTLGRSLLRTSRKFRQQQRDAISSLASNYVSSRKEKASISLTKLSE